MGLLSFFNTRKGHGAGDTGSLGSFQDPGVDTFRGQAYDSTALSLPPIRGDRPVAGNGPNKINDLQRVARKRSEAQLSTRSASKSPAPSPLVPRLRSKSFARPSTAPSPAPLPHNRPKSSGRTAPRQVSVHSPPLPLQKNRKGPPYLLGVTGPDDDNDNDSAIEVPPPVPLIASRFRDSRASPVSSRPATAASNSRRAPESIAESVMSGRSTGTGTGAGSLAGTFSAGPGYVDILDAQGSIKPSDFRTRLRAAGARDYGEDVADRNIGVNGVDLRSPAVVAFYALTGGGPLAYRSDGSAVDVHGNRYAAGNIPTNLSSGAQGKDRHELSAMANERIRTPRFPTRTTSLEPHEPANIYATDDDVAMARTPSRREDAISKEQRRKSIHGGHLSSPNPDRHPKPRPLSMHPVGRPTFEPADAPDVPRIRHTPSPVLEDRPSALATAPRARSKRRSNLSGSNDENIGQRLRSPSPGPPPPPPKDTRARSHSTRSARSTGSQASPQKRKKKTRHRDLPLESDQTSPARPRSMSSSSRKGRRKHQEGLDQFDFGIPSSGEYIPAVPSFGSSTRLRSSGSPARASYKNSHPALTGSSSTSHSRKRSGNSAWTILDDISEHLPGRSSSGRNESVSSMTASTTATASSSLPPRSQSRHTADTSLDLDYSLPEAMKQQRKQHHKGGSDASARSRATANSRIRDRSSAATLNNRYNEKGQCRMPVTAEGYAASTTSTTESSDGDMYQDMPQRRRHDDEDLLFREGDYQSSGGGFPGLPGLPGLMDSSSPVELEDGPVTPTWSSIQPSSGTQKHSTRRRPPTSAPFMTADMAKEKTTSVSEQLPVPFPTFGYDSDDSDDSFIMSGSDRDNCLRPGTAGTKPSSTEAASAAATSPSTVHADSLDIDPRYEQVEAADTEEHIEARLAMQMRREMKRRERDAPRPTVQV